MPNPCPQCGVALAWATRECPRCGAPLHDAATSLLEARPPADPTLDGPADTRATDGRADPRAAPGPVADTDRAPGDARPVRDRGTPRAWWAQSRHRTLVAIAVCGVVLGVAVGLAFAVGNHGVEPNRVAPAAPRHRRLVGGAPPTAPAISADQQRELGYLSQLESVLQQSAAGRTVLVGALQGAPGSCTLSPAAAAVLVHGVVQNRTNLLNELGAMPPAPNAEAQQLEQLLQAALHASSQADGEYEAWLDANGLADPRSCSDSSSPTIALYWNSARASDSTATTAKTAFVTAFNPVAARFSLPTWTASQF